MARLRKIGGVPRDTRQARCGALIACALAIGAWSCGGPGNSGRIVIDPETQREVPWLNGGIPVLSDLRVPVYQTSPVFPPIGQNLPDPGSGPPNCRALEGIDMENAMLDTFELQSADAGIGVAPGWSGFNDKTRGAFHVPGDISWYQEVKRKAMTIWGLPAVPVLGPSCDGKPNDWALHFRGGLFRLWGAGMSHVFSDPKVNKNDVFCPPGADFCAPMDPPGPLDSAGIPKLAASGDEYQQSHDFVDASRYEGIAFWARRGPDGQERMNVTVTDNFTSGRLARENQKYCRRIRECRTRCESGLPCVQNSIGIYRCLDPSADPKLTSPEANLNNPAGVDSLVDLMYPKCGPSACAAQGSYIDKDFDDKECRPYTFPAADESAEYCFNADDPPPPGRDERCLDGFATSVGLTLDWQFYTVPFSELQQGGYGKKAPYLNLKAIDVVSFSFLVGYADAFIDNVAFYRHKK